MGLDALNLEPYEALIGPTVPQVQVDAVQIEEQPPALVSRPPSLAQMLRSSGKLDDDQIAQTEESPPPALGRAPRAAARQPDQGR